MLAAVLAALALAAAPGPADAARAELEAVAHRIADLKERRLAGDDVDEELTRLLVRAQELAAVVERSAPRTRPQPAAGPTPEELRERADAARDEADRVVAQIEEVDRTMEEVDRERRREAALEALSEDSALFGDGELGNRRAARASAGTGTGGDAPSDPAPMLAQPSRRAADASGSRKDAALPAAGAAAEVKSLQAQRAALAERLAALKAEAARLDAAADNASKD